MHAPDPFAIVRATAVRPDPERLRLHLLPRATIVVNHGRIASLGQDAPVPPGLPIVDAAGGLVTPGLVDSHTHAHFLGDRAAEFCARAAGESYLAIAQRGGGIRATVGPTRAGTPDERVARLRLRLRRLAAQGVTTVEVKSGYGLSVADELAQLSEIAGLSGDDLPRVSPTLLAAHAIPPEVTTAEERARWVRAIADELIPEVARRGLATRVDAFVEASAYTHEEARVVADAARRHGLALHLHVDQLTANGGAELAAALGAQAVSHLEKVADQGVSALAKAGVIATLLPTATLAAREPAYAPARKLVAAGVKLAVATNLNPGTGPTESFALAFFLAAVGLQLTAEELLWAATRGGALALGMTDRGLLDPGAPADLVLWNAREIEHLPYHAGINHAARVWRDGRLLVEREPECDGLL